MKRIIKSNSDGLTIEVSEIAEAQDRLLAEFQACQEGRCSCPTDEYKKVDSLEIAARTGKISLRLKAKTGQVFDGSAIHRCLDHTESKLPPIRWGQVNGRSVTTRDIPEPAKSTVRMLTAMVG